MNSSLIKFRGILFDKKTGKINVGDSSFFLEHQQTKILNLLVDNPNTVISREQIAQHVWQGIIVEDNTISKAITRLRKVLNDSAKSSQIIKTIPKQGYQFIADIEYCNPSELSTENAINISKTDISKNDTPQNKFNRTYVFLLTAIVASAAVIFSLSFLLSLPPSETETSKVAPLKFSPIPLSYREGVELNAHLQPNRQRLLFIGDHKDGYAIFSKQMGSANSALITSVSSRRVFPKWLDDESDHFVYSDLDAEQQCQIYQSSTSNPEKKSAIATCLSDSAVEVFIAGSKQTIVWSDNSGNWQQALETNRRTALPFADKSIKYQMPSPDLTLWGTLTENNESSILTVYELASKNIVMEKHLPYVISHFKWSKNGNALYHLGEHPAIQLYQLTLDGKQTLIASTSLGNMTYISDVQTDNTIEFAISAVDLDIHQLSNNQESKLINSAFPDYNPALSAKSHHLAFASKRTGSAQIWMKRNEQLIQLSNFNRASYIYDIAWSPAEDKLLVKRNNHLHIFDVKTKSDTTLSIDTKNKVAWQWISNKELAFVDLASNSLFSIDVNTANTTPLKSEVSFAQYTGKYWFISDTSKQNLIQLEQDLSFKQHVSSRLNNRHWVVNSEQVYVVNTKPKQPNSLVKLLPDGSEHPILSGSFVPFSIQSLDQGVFVFHRNNRREANIYQLQLK